MPGAPKGAVQAMSEYRLPATEEAPRHARALLARDLGDSVSLEDREVAQLPVSELVTNAVRHTPSDVIQANVGLAGHVRVGVTDVSNSMPQLRSAKPGDVEGRGLLILEALAEHWGIDVMAEGGKRIWFELPV
jgi:serine/threonine-protein kinase RsbW